MLVVVGYEKLTTCTWDLENIVGFYAIHIYEKWESV